MPPSRKYRPDVYEMRKDAERLLDYEELSHEECANLAAIETRAWTRFEAGGPRMPDGMVKCFWFAVCLQAIEECRDLPALLGTDEVTPAAVTSFFDEHWQKYDPLNPDNVQHVDNHNANQ